MATKFSRIITGELPGSFVYRDDRVAAFMDIGQINDGHVLVVPVTPATCLAELDDDTAGHLFVVALRIAAAVRKSGLKCEAVNLFLADGEAAGQDVFHVHLHVIPRFEGDGFEIKVPEHYHAESPRAELDSHASKIRSVLEKAV
jgi:histidine triad (HIT) family protein